jgi:hypothetical protein
MMNPQTGWQTLMRNAQARVETGEIFVSPKQGKRYRITAVQSDRVELIRLSVEPHTLDDITLYRFNGMITRLNEKGGRMHRDNWKGYSVAKQALVVSLLSPLLDWVESGKDTFIEENETLLREELQRALIEAPNDDPNETVQRSIRRRRGQNILPRESYVDIQRALLHYGLFGSRNSACRSHHTSLAYRK